MEHGVVGILLKEGDSISHPLSFGFGSRRHVTDRGSKRRRCFIIRTDKSADHTLSRKELRKAEYGKISLPAAFSSFSGMKKGMGYVLEDQTGRRLRALGKSESRVQKLSGPRRRNFDGKCVISQRPNDAPRKKRGDLDAMVITAKLSRLQHQEEAGPRGSEQHDWTAEPVTQNALVRRLAQSSANRLPGTQANDLLESEVSRTCQSAIFREWYSVALPYQDVLAGFVKWQARGLGDQKAIQPL